MKKKLCLAMMLVPVVLTQVGCGQHSRKSVVIMQHPETMDFVNCAVDHWETPLSYAKNDRCVEDLKSKGYVVWGER